ncbi:5'/3'-nucleotidase SurE [Rhizobium sp. TH2]|uniref:5'/3'-nucleotidase SurE n=1 Tax=Rhizobium sp. TH2 TaxID=2775403 RepID=UPI002157E50B|nr:5'/3'-nucleotidase SurE [Rhizobium sp. TH2]UVC10852.1 5'/3'-nucleotidase SurE [Rhizobium sp. TH2]
MRILLTNDDGIHAEGLAVLERIARTLSDDVWIVAPETDQSGLAHSLTLSEPLRLRQVSEKHFALRGTPTDCVIMGVREVLGGKKPDLVLSGVNNGANMADDVTYSGTIAGAIEGTLQGIKSFAISQAANYVDGERLIPWEIVETFAPALLKKLINVEMPDWSFMNLNFPNCKPEDIKGIAVTAQGKLDFGINVEKRSDGRGLPYYWLKFDSRKGDFRDGTDIHALKENKISVTPLKLDLTDYDLLDRIQKAVVA